MNKEKVAELFNDSYARCSRNPAFLDIFYELFLTASPDVTEKFKDTDFVRQKRMLRGSLLHLISAHTGQDAHIRLGVIAETHSADGYNIEPHFYDLWRSCMLQAVEKCDPRFDDQVKEAWEVVINDGIQFLISKYK